MSLEDNTRASRYDMNNENIIINHNVFVLFCKEGEVPNPALINKENTPWQKVHFQRFDSSCTEKEHIAAIKIALECNPQPLSDTEKTHAWVLEQPLPPSLPEQAEENKKINLYSLSL